jgi:exosortase
LGALGVSRAVVAFRGEIEGAVDAELFGAGPVEVEFLFDETPRGSAGCVRDALENLDCRTVLIIEAGVLWTPRGPGAIAGHLESGAALTVFTDGSDRPVGVYAARSDALGLVRSQGYQDLKEQLIPELLAGGEDVRCETVSGSVVAAASAKGYRGLAALAAARPADFGVDGGVGARDGVRIFPNAVVDETARLVAPVVAMDGAVVEGGAVVVGPAIIEAGALIGDGAVVAKSFLWADAEVGRRARVTGCIVDEGGVVPAGRVVHERAVASRDCLPGGKAIEKPREGRSVGSSGRSAALRRAAILLLPAAFIWSYWGVIRELWAVWMTNDNYSSGLLVPPLAAYLAYSRRRSLAEAGVSSSLWGLGVVAAGFLMRFAGTLLLYGSAERLSIILVITGLVVTLTGWRTTLRVKWILVFLLLMLPWPTRLYAFVSLPLQEWATHSAVFVLELLGWAVIREGNILHLGDASVAVAEACSGLRMLTAFLLVSAVTAFVCRRPAWQNVILVVSSVFIGVLCNTIRLAATAIAFTAGYGERINTLFHDLGGIMMMPLALALLAGLLWVLNRVYVPAEGGVGGASQDLKR